MSDTQSPSGSPTPGPLPDPGFRPPPGPPGWGPALPPPPPPRRTGLRVLAIVAAVVLGVPVVLFVVALIAVAARGGPAPAATPAAAGGSGQSTILQLKRGDCFNSAPVPSDGSDVGVGSVQTVPCTSPHSQQVVDTVAFPGMTWESGGSAQAAESCGLAMKTDLRPEVRKDSSYTPAALRAIVPSSGQNSLYIVCTIGTGSPRTGSALR